jgi:hypothetical protein
VLLNWPKESGNPQGDSRVRGGFKFMPRISKLQGFITLEETPLVKSNHGYKINTTSYRGNNMTGGHPRIQQENFKTKFLAQTSSLT